MGDTVQRCNGQYETSMPCYCLSRPRERFVRFGLCYAYLFSFVVVIFFLVGSNLSYPTNIQESISKYSGPTPSGLDEELLVFMQVSDIHIKASDPEPAKQLEQFVSEIVPAIDPSFVVASGDLTNARTWRGVQSREEWEAYKSIIENHITNVSSFWYDIRGNHDAFSAGQRFSSTNLYEEYGFSRAELRASLKGVSLDGVSAISYYFDKNASAGGQSYRFIGFDSAVDPGLIRLFNFFGYNPPELEEELFSYLVPDKPTILFSHFPELTLTRRLSSKIRSNALYFLNGHLHQKNMYQRNRNEVMIEIEADDLAYSQGFRILTWDHGVLSFADLTLNDPFPAAIVSNPKDARFITAGEPNHVLNSTHIRILAFTSQDANITSVEVSIDNGKFETSANPCCGADSRLFVAPWVPADFATGLHTIGVSIRDSSNRIKTLKQEFSIDGSLGEITQNVFQLGQFLGDFTVLLQIQFALTVVYLLIILLLTRKILGKYIFGYYILFLAFFSIGPMFIGTAMTDTIGVIFPYGIAIDGAFTPCGTGLLVCSIVITVSMYPSILFALRHLYQNRWMVESEQGYQFEHFLNHANYVSNRERSFECLKENMKGDCKLSWFALGRYYVIFFIPFFNIYVLTRIFEDFVSILLSPSIWFAFSASIFACFLSAEEAKTSKNEMKPIEL